MTAQPDLADMRGLLSSAADRLQEIRDALEYCGCRDLTDGIRDREELLRKWAGGEHDATIDRERERLHRVLTTRDDLLATLKAVSTALPALRTICLKAGLVRVAAKAAEMSRWIKDAVAKAEAAS
jgi:hypothetical protein